MFDIFKNKSKLNKLKKEYKCLIEQSYKLSNGTSLESDKKQLEAQKILEQIEVLQHV